jgi:hypothetical protein
MYYIMLEKHVEKCFKTFWMDFYGCFFVAF